MAGGDFGGFWVVSGRFLGVLEVLRVKLDPVGSWAEGSSFNQKLNAELKGRKSFRVKGCSFIQILNAELKEGLSFRAKGCSFNQKLNAELKGEENLPGEGVFLQSEIYYRIEG